MFSLYLSPDSATNTDLDTVKCDDHEFAIFAEFIFTCDSMNVINNYSIIILPELFGRHFYSIDTFSLILLKQ